jgi:hypothetical protein
MLLTIKDNVRVASYYYLGIALPDNGSCNIHMQKVLNCGKKNISNILTICDAAYVDAHGIVNFMGDIP